MSTKPPKGMEAQEWRESQAGKALEVYNRTGSLTAAASATKETIGTVVGWLRKMLVVVAHPVTEVNTKQPIRISYDEESQWKKGARSLPEDLWAIIEHRLSQKSISRATLFTMRTPNILIGSKRFDFGPWVETFLKCRRCGDLLHSGNITEGRAKSHNWLCSHCA